LKDHPTHFAQKSFSDLHSRRGSQQRKKMSRRRRRDAEWKRKTGVANGM